MVNDTGRSISSDNFAIQSSSRMVASAGVSPAVPCGATSNTARPPAAMARPSPNSSASAAYVPGTASPSMARCARLDGLLHDAGHRGDVVLGGLFVACTALAHGVAPDRPVRDLRAVIDSQVPLFDGVEVLREGLPLPGDALGQR